jgi:hypothetical protein
MCKGVCYVHQSSWMDGGSFSGTTPSRITLKRSQTRSSSGARISLSLKMVSRSFTVSFIGISSSSPLVFHLLCNTRTSLIFFHVFSFRYIYHELIPKETLSASFLPDYVESGFWTPPRISCILTSTMFIHLLTSSMQGGIWTVRKGSFLPWRFICSLL